MRQQDNQDPANQIRAAVSNAESISGSKTLIKQIRCLIHFCEIFEWPEVQKYLLNELESMAKPSSVRRET